MEIMEMMEVDKKKKNRKRKKKLYAQIREQMEFYFGDSNLQKDRFLKKQISLDPDGYVDLAIFSNFNKLKSITTDMDLVAKAVASSDLIEVSPDGQRIRRSKPLADRKDVDQRTVYVECFPKNIDHDWMKQIFSTCGKVMYVSLPKYKSSGDLKGFGFVEFETVKQASKACEVMNNPPATVDSQIGRFPKVGSKQMQHLRKQVEQANPEGFIPGLGMEPFSNIPSRPDHTHEQLGVRDKDETQESTTEEGNTNHPASSTAEGEPPAKKRKKHTSESSAEVKVTDEVRKAEDVRVTEELSDRLSDTDRKRKSSEAGDEEQSSSKKRKVETEKVTEELSQKKRKKRKKNKKEKISELPELRVIPKREWIKLRDEYLALQRSNMQILKKSLLQLHQDKHSVQTETSSTAVNEEVKKERKPIEVTLGVIVKVTSNHPVTRKQVKEMACRLVKVVYVDWIDGDTEGKVRCADPGQAGILRDSSSQDYSFSILSGEEEQEYWAKVQADREQKLSAKHRTRRRGTQRIIEKAEKISTAGIQSQHVFFED